MWSFWNPKMSDFWVTKFMHSEDASDTKKDMKEKNDKYGSHPKGKSKLSKWNGFLWKASYHWTFSNAC